MSLEDVIDKIRIGNLSNQGSPGFEQRTDELLGNLYALGGEIQAMLDAMVSDPRNFQVEFLNDGTEAGEGEDSYTGDWTYAARIDYNWVESNLTYVASDGVAQKFSAEAMLAHELAHLAYWDEPDGIDPNDRSDFEERRFEIIFNPAENKGKAVEIEASVQAALGEGQRISYFSAVGHSNMPTSLEVGYDYSPTGFGSGVVDVVFVDAYNDMALSQSGTITLSDYSATDRFLLVLGGANNSVIGGNSGDYIHTGGGLDFVGVSGGSDYIDGGSGEGLGTQGDTLQFGSQLVTVVLSLADGTGIEGDAIFAALKSATETDHFTDFERVLFSDGANNLAFDSDAVLDALASENVTIVGGEGTDQIDGQLLDQGVIIDFAAGEMYFQDEAIAKLSLVGFENASGSDFNDVLRGNEEANELLGLGGDDFIFFDFADGANVNGGAGRDVAVALGQNGVTVDMAAQGLECVIGCDGADVITVSGGTDPVFAAGGGGADRFILDNLEAQGPRILWGGDGADVFEFQNGGRVSLAVVNIDGLTEEAFSRLTLADLGLGNIDLSLLSAIIINPDATDRFHMDDTLLGTSSVDLSEWSQIGDDLGALARHRTMFNARFRNRSRRSDGKLRVIEAENHAEHRLLAA